MDMLNIGAGNRIIADCVNHDLTVHRPEIDIAHDLNVLPWPWGDESFDKVLAIAVLEHVRHNLIVTVNEIWRILRPGGVLSVKLPHWNADGSYIDPTHYWRFSLRSLEVFDPDTEYGGHYSFYTPCKWRITKPARLNRARTSIHAHMEKIA